MLIELLVGAGVVALSAVAVRTLRKGRTKANRAPGDEPSEEGVRKPARDTGDGKSPRNSARSGPARSGKDQAPRPPDPRGLRVGDVLLYADTELWLAGEVHLDEEGFALSLFCAPGGSRASWVAQLDPEAQDVAFLAETSEVPDGAVPTELPIGGMRLSLRRRGQADVRRCGEHLPATTERASFVILGGPGDRLLVVVDFAGGDRISLVGDSVSADMFDLLPGGDLER